MLSFHKTGASIVHNSATKILWKFDIESMSSMFKCSVRFQSTSVVTVIAKAETKSKNKMFMGCDLNSILKN